MTVNTENTTNNAFPVPTDANDGVDFGTGLFNYAQSVDGMWSSGTISARPAAGKVNRVYYGTDTDIFYKDTGAAWATLITAPALVLPGAMNYTAKQGQFIAAYQGYTVTLPSAAASVLPITIQAGSGVTGGSPVTIACASGNGIVGPGLPSGPSSIVLGAPGVTVTLTPIGNYWYSDAPQDTGWLPLTLSSGISAASSGYAPGVRVTGDRVELCGIIENSSGSSITGGTALFTLPASAVPATYVELSTSYVWESGTALNLFMLDIDNPASGQTALPPNAFVNLNGLSYRLN